MMATFTALQIADTWIAAGGPEPRAVEWTAISYGESSFETAVVSSAGAIGPWQIMPEHAAEYGYTVDDLYEPLINARIAVKLSGGGVNCAAWDSAYADINASGRYSFLGWPEVGSADYNNLQLVSVWLGKDKLGGQAPPPGAVVPPQVAQTAAQLGTLANKLYPSLAKLAVAQHMAISAAYVPGWRP